jgi:DNA-binding LacI/PurR family transcriptional regulator
MIERVTQLDIARATKLHPTTVSLALRASPKLRPETVQAVKNAAARLGYRPDPALSALNAYRLAHRKKRELQVIAWLDVWRHLDQKIFTTGVFSTVFRHAREHAEQKGFHLESFHLGPGGYTAARLASVLYQRGVQGILVGPLPGGRAHLRFPWDKFSAVAISSSLARPELHRVYHDHHLNMRLLLRGVRHAGRRRPGLVIMRHEDQRTDNLRYATFVAQEILPRDLQPTRPVPPLVEETLTEARLIEWYRRHKPDAILAVRATYVAAILRSAGVRVPEDVLVASPCAQDHPGFPGVVENRPLLVATAIDHLAGMIHRGERGLPKEPIRLLLPGAWTNGEGEFAARRTN